jgi:transposase-like protein
MGTRPAVFKWRQTEPGLILCAVRWYLRYSLSLRDVEELLEERGLNVDHTTVWRWVQDYGPELDRDYEGISSRQTSLGEWTKPTFA